MTTFTPHQSPSIASYRIQTLTSSLPFTFRCSSYFTRNPNSTRKNPNFKPKTPEFFIDIDRIKQDLTFELTSLKLHTRYKLKRFVNSGTDAIDDLRNMVVVDDGRRIMISCKKSSLVFLGNFVVWSFVVCLGFKVLVGLVMWLRGCLGFGKSGGGGVMVRRDRSLGGREVVVAKGENVKMRDRGVEGGVLSEGVARGMGIKSRGRREEKLPGWFPLSVSQQVVAAESEEGQRMAKGLVRAIMDAKVNGRDVSAGDMIELRRICRTYGARAHFDTTNARDSFYRTCIDLVLNMCCRIPNHYTSVRIDGEDPRWFIAGLGNNLGIEHTQAARMVTAAIAARTRSCLLQAWALQLQQKRAEALAELTKIIVLHQIFPPEESSPEMEMVAKGLQKQLTLEHRQFLLNMIVDICGNERCTSMADALGLVYQHRPENDAQIADAERQQL